MVKVKELVSKVLPKWENLKISIYVDDGEGTYGLYSDDETVKCQMCGREFWARSITRKYCPIPHDWKRHGSTMCGLCDECC